MDPDRWRRIDELFHAAADLDPHRREAFLDERCAGDPELRAELEHLLTADETEDRLLDHTPSPAARPAHSSAGTTDAMVGRELGPWRLTSRLAVGGMGVVYLAERSDGLFEQRAALKLIRIDWASEGIVRRFEFERRTLAALSHPNIARLFDGGSTEEGVPYLVMEFVAGAPIDSYCDTHRSTLRERLRLFVSVCRAVHYAHQSLVVHRDLKPSNVLVDEHGEPKLLDFGIAQLVESDDEPGGPALTGTLARILTPEYASPEQFTQGPVTTAIDVYSLGVVLYELTTGRKPLRCDSRSPLEWHRMIVEDMPTRPSAMVVRPPAAPAGASREPDNDEVAARFRSTPRRLRRELRGDLDRILLTALRKEPERRYASVAELADDIERHLDGRPVLAREDSLVYRCSKFVSRNRIAVAAALTVTVALLVGFVSSRRSERRAVVEAQHVSIEAESFQGITRFLMDTFLTTGVMDAQAVQRARRSVLMDAERVRRQYAGENHLRANLLDALGTVCLRLDLFDDSERLFREALEIRSLEFGERSLEFALSLGSLGKLDYARGDFQAAAENLERALELHRSAALSPHTNVALAANDLAACWRNLGRVDEAQELHVEALALRRRAQPRSLPVAESLNNLAGIHLDRREFGRACEVLREAHEIRDEILGERHPLTLQSRANLATALWQKGEREAAVEHMQRSIEGLREQGADGAEGLGRALSNLAAFNAEQGDLDAATRALGEALEILEGCLGPEHPYVLAVLVKIAVLEGRQGRLDQARRSWEVALERQRRSGSPATLARTLGNYGAFLRFLAGDLEAAEGCLGEAAEVLRELEPGDPTALGWAELELAECLAQRGDAERAREGLDQARAAFEQAAEPDADGLERVSAGLAALD